MAATSSISARFLRAWLLGTTALLPASGAALAQGLSSLAPNTAPTGGRVTAGSAVINQTAATTTVTQATQRGVVDWQTFNVGRNHGVTFVQPNAQAWTLNRVNTPDPSVIAGSITANGGVAIVNQSGVVFAQGSQVNVGSLIASAAGITNQNFMAGNMVFDQAPNPGARVENHGNIRVADRGLVALVGPRVGNTGTINARLGRVALAGAETYNLDLAGDGLLSIDVTQAVRQAPDGSTALVTNSGVISAQGGSVQLSAHAASGLVEDLVRRTGSDVTVRNTGTIRANTTAEGQRGQVALRAEGGSAEIGGRVTARGRGGQAGGSIRATATGDVIVTAAARVGASGAAGGGSVQIGDTATRNATVGGRVRARGTGAAARGGSVAVQAAGDVTLAPGAVVDTSGTAGGGAIRLGTTGFGRNQQMAQRTLLDAGSTVRADALGAGDGGNIAINSLTVTAVLGEIWAQGGATGGNGGFVELSSRGRVAIPSLSTQLHLGAPAGSSGTLLLDPVTLTITGDTDPPPATSLSNVLDGDATTTVRAIDINATSANLLLQAEERITVAAEVNKANGGLTLETTTSNNTAGGIGPGVFVNAGITLGTGALTIISATGINLAAPVDAGTVALQAAGAISQTSAGIITASNFSAMGQGGTGTNAASIALSTATNAIGTVTEARADGDISIRSSANMTATTVASSGATNGAATLVELQGNGGLVLDGTVNAGGGALVLRADGAISQSAGTISAGTLTMGGLTVANAGSIDLTQAGNSFATLSAANATGPISIRNDAANWAVTAASGNGVRLTGGGGNTAITVDGAVNAGAAGSLAIDTTGDLTVSATGSLAGKVINVERARGITLNGAVGVAGTTDSVYLVARGTSGVSAAGEPLSASSAGFITQTSGGIISAGHLDVISAGTITLTQANQIDSVAGTSAGNVGITSGRPLEITNTLPTPIGGGVFTGLFIRSSGLALALQAPTITLNASLGGFTGLTGQTVTLTSNDLILNTGRIAAPAGQINLRSLSAGNGFTLGGTAAGTVSLSDAELALLGGSGASGDTVPATRLRITTSDGVTLAGDVNLRGRIGILELEGSGTVDQTGGSLDVARLVGRMAGNFNVARAGATNRVDEIAVTRTTAGAGTVAVSSLHASATTLTVVSDSGPNGITNGIGGVTTPTTVTLAGNALALNAPVAGATVTLLADGAVAQNASGLITAGTLAVRGASGAQAGSVSLGQANPVAAFTANASGAVSFRSAAATLTLNDVTAGGTGIAITGAGAIDLPNGKAISASAGDVAITADAGAITLDGAVSGTSGNIAITASAGDIALGGAVTATAGSVALTAGGDGHEIRHNAGGSIDAPGNNQSIILTADAMDLGNGGNIITAAGTAGQVILQAFSGGTGITLAGSAGGTLSLSANELDRISTTMLSIRAGSSGAIAIAGNLDLGGIATELNLQGASVGLEAGRSLTVSRLSGAVTGNFILGDALAGAVNQIAELGTITAGGDLTVTSQAATLTVSGAVSGGSGRTVTLRADDIALTGSLAVTGGGTVAILPDASNRAVTLGDSLTPSGLHLDSSEITRISTGGGTLRVGAATALSASTAGAITVAGNLLLRGAGNGDAATLQLRGGSVAQTGGMVDVAMLTGSTTGAFSLNGASNAYDSIGPVNGTDIHLRSTGALDVTGAVTSTSAGTVRIETDGVLTVTAGGSVTAGSKAGADAGVVNLWGSGIALAGTVEGGNGVTLVASNSMLGLAPDTPGNDITQSGAGVVVARRLFAAGGGALAMGLANQVDLATLVAGSGGLLFQAAGPLTLSTGAGPAPIPNGGTAAGANGAASTGTIAITSGDALTVSGTVLGINGVNLTATGEAALGADVLSTLGNVGITANEPGSAITQTAGSIITVPGGTATLTADAITLGGSGINAGATGTVILQAASGNRDVTLGGTVADTLSVASTANITAGRLVIGTGATSGNITAVGAFSVGGATLELHAAGTIGQGAGATLTAGALSAQAGGSITLNEANTIAQLVDATTGSDLTTGFLAGGDASFRSSAALLTVSTNARVSNAGSLALRADDLAIAAGKTLNAPAGGTIAILPHSTGLAVTLGDSAAPAGLHLDSTEIARIDTDGGTLRIGASSAATVPSAGAIRLDGNVLLRGAGNGDAGTLDLRGGSVTQSGGSVDVATLTGETLAGTFHVGLAGNAIDNVGGITAAGLLQIASDLALTVDGPASGSGLGNSGFAGKLGITLNGDVTVTGGGTLVLFSNGTVSQSGGRIEASAVSVRGFDVPDAASLSLLRPGNDFARLSASASGPVSAFSLASGGTLTVAGATGSSVTVTSATDMAVTGAVTAMTGDVTLSANRPSGSFSRSAGSISAPSANGVVTINADTIDLGAGADAVVTGANGRVLLRPVTPGRPVVLGAVVADTFSVVGGGGISTGRVIIGTPMAGDMTVAGAFSVGGAVLELLTGGGITQNAGAVLTAGALSATAASDILLGEANAIATITGSTAAPAVGFSAGGDGSFGSNAALVTVNADMQVGNLRDLVLRVDDLAIPGGVQLRAPVGGTVAILPNTAGAGVTLGDSAAPSGLHLDSAEITRIDTDGGTLRIGSTTAVASPNAGTIRVDGDVALRGAGNGDADTLDLRGGNIVQNGGAVDVARLAGAAVAGGFSMDAAGNLIDMLGGITSFGDAALNIRSANTLTIAGNVVADAPAIGDLTTVSITSGGSVTVQAGVSVRSTHGDAVITAAGTLTTGTGAVISASDQYSVVSEGAPETTYGNVTLSASGFSLSAGSLDARLVAGTQFGRNVQITQTAGTLAFDAASLAGAPRRDLILNAGAGAVTLAGTVAPGRDLTVTAQGGISILAGANFSAAGTATLTATAGGITNQLGASLGGTVLTLSAGDALVNAGSLGGGTISLTAASIGSSGGISGGSTTLSATIGDFINSGTTSGGPLVGTVAGNFLNTSTGTIGNDTTTISATGSARNDGIISATGSASIGGGTIATNTGSISALGGSASLSGGGDASNSGSIIAGNAVSLTAGGAAANSGTMTGGSATVTGGNASNTGTITATSGNAAITAGSGNATNGGTVSAANGGATLGATGGVASSSGNIQARTVGLSGSDGVTNSGSITATENDAVLVAAGGTASNSGIVSAARHASLSTLGGPASNSGSIMAGTATVPDPASTATLTGTGAADNSGSMAGPQVVLGSSTGAVVNSGSLAGRITVSAGTSFTNTLTGGISGSSGTLIAGGAMSNAGSIALGSQTVSAASFDNIGTVSSGTQGYTVNSGNFSNSGSIGTGPLTATIAGDFSNTGTISSGTVSIAAAGTAGNSGSIGGSGTVSVSGAAGLANSGSITSTSGDVTLASASGSIALTAGTISALAPEPFGVVTLNAPNGAVTQTGGSILARRLAGIAAGTINLGQDTNAIQGADGITAGGDVTLRSLSPVLTVSGTVAAGAGRTLTLLVDDLALSAALSAPNGSIILRPHTASRGYVLGGASGSSNAGMVTLDDAEIALLPNGAGTRAALIRIGTLSGGVIGIAGLADFAAAGSGLDARTTQLDLLSGGSITQAANTRLVVPVLSATAGGAVLLDPGVAGNRVETLAGIVAPGGFTLRSAAPLLTLNAGGGGDAIIVGTGQRITLRADDLAVNAPVRAPAGVIEILPETSGQGITLGGAAGGTLALTGAELGLLGGGGASLATPGASLLRIGGNSSGGGTTAGDITFAGTVDLGRGDTARFSTLDLLANGNVTGTSGALVVGLVQGNVTGNLLLDNDANAFAAGVLTAGSGRTLALSTAADLMLTGAVTASGGTVSLRSLAGISETGAGIVNAGTLRLSSGSAVTLAAANGFANLGASSIGAGPSLVRGTGFNVAGPVNATGTLTLQADGALGSTGNITSSGNLTLTAGGALAVTGGLITTGSDLNATAGSGVTVQGAGLAATNRLRLNASSSMRLAGAALNAETAELRAATIRLDGGGAAIGTAILFAAPGGINAGGLTTIAPRAGGRLPAVVFDTRSSPAIDPLSQVQPDVPGLQPAQQATQVRIANVQAPGDFGTARTNPAGDVALNLEAGSSAVFLLLDGGSAAGNINAGRLGIHGSGGNAALFGTLFNQPGVGAARHADLTRPADPVTLMRYRVNGCVVSSINCVVPPMVQMIPQRPSERANLAIENNRLDTSEVTIPNVAEAEYQ